MTLINQTLRALSLTSLAVALSIGGIGCTKKPGSGGSGSYNPQGKGAAPEVATGTFYYNINTDPTTLNPITSVDVAATQVHGYVIESLAARNDDTYEFQPMLASSWEISPDGKLFTFKLRGGVKWHDGKPLTAEDVKFSYDAIMDPKFDTASKRPYYENIAKVEVIDPKTVRFTTKNTYFGNFESAATLNVVPKHIYQDPKKEGLSKILIGTGPYILDQYERGQRVVLKKNPEWWGNSDPLYRGEHNFAKVILRFVQEDNVAVEMLKKGELDFMGFSAETFNEKTKGDEWGKKVFAVKVENSSPKSYGYIGWNLRKDLFKDKNVRKALTHAFNRQLIIEKFLYNMSVPAVGPWHFQSIYASDKVKPLEYNPDLALKLFREAGWSDTDKDGILDKKIGSKKVDFKFTLMTASKDTLKYFTVFKEDAKQIGVDIDIQLLEWSTFIKLLDEEKFDAVALGWGGGSVDLDPKQIWHSDSAVKGGSNFINYKNPEVDKLIDEGRMIMDRDKRAEVFRKVYEIIADDAPYLFLFNSKYAMYGHTAKMHRPKDTYKFTVGLSHWWIEE